MPGCTGTPGTAAAHKLARIIYHLLTRRQPYYGSSFIVQEIRFRKRKEARLRAQARELGFQLIAVEVAGRTLLLRRALLRQIGALGRKPCCIFHLTNRGTDASL